MSFLLLLKKIFFEKADVDSSFRLPVFSTLAFSLPFFLWLPWIRPSYFLDDLPLLDAIRDASFIEQISHFALDDRYWRPLGNLLLFLNFELGLYFSSLASAFIIGSCSLLVFSALRSLSFSRVDAFIVSALCFCLPFLAESVIWNSGRFDLILCLASSFVFFIASARSDSPPYAGAAFIIGFAAALTKDFAFPLSIVWLGAGVFLRNSFPSFKIFFWAALGCAATLPLRLFFHDGDFLVSGTDALSLNAVFGALSYSLSLASPFNIRVFSSLNPAEISLLWLMLLVPLLFALVSKRLFAVSALLIGCFFLCASAVLLTFSAGVPYPLGGRYFSAALPFLSLFLVLLLRQREAWRAPLILFFSVCLTSAMFFSFQSARVWSSPDLAWASMADEEQAVRDRISERTAHGFAQTLREAKRFNEAVAFLDWWLSAYPNESGVAANFRASLSLERGDADNALRILDEQRNPSFWGLFVLRAQIRAAAGRCDEAVNDIRQAFELSEKAAVPSILNAERRVMLSCLN